MKKPGDQPLSAERILSLEGPLPLPAPPSPVSGLQSSLLSQTAALSSSAFATEMPIVPVIEERNPQPSADSGYELSSLRDKLSSLELENGLLKQEVRSLTDELRSVMKRTREASEGEYDYSGQT